MRMFTIFVVLAVAVLGVHPRRVPKSTLQMVHVLFRHAQRTPDVATIYPKDPYKNETYLPYGWGALTKEGFKTQYGLGKELRARYGNFLGSYAPGVLKAQASPYGRTKNAMQLVLASLFPPSGERSWNPNLQWQPIDFQYNPMNKDLLFLSYQNCKNYLKLQKEYFKELRENGSLESLNKISEYLTYNTGWNVTNPLQAFLVYAALLSEEEWGFKLPKWTEEVYPEPLHSIAVDFLDIASQKEELKTLNGGFILRDIAEQTAKKINGTDSIKISLYSGHDFTIVGLLSVLGVFKPHLPPYAAYVLVEVHEIDDVYGLKFFYNDYTTRSPELLRIPGCDDLCPFDKFLTFYSNYFADEKMCT